VVELLGGNGLLAQDLYITPLSLKDLGISERFEYLKVCPCKFYVKYGWLLCRKHLSVDNLEEFFLLWVIYDPIPPNHTSTITRTVVYPLLLGDVWIQRSGRKWGSGFFLLLKN